MICRLSFQPALARFMDEIFIQQLRADLMPIMVFIERMLFSNS
jgi:hypothetical protein